MTRVLVFSTLFPSAVQPNHGVFVENRLRETCALGGLSVTVIAPVPFFPSTNRAFGRYALFARTPRREIRAGIEVLHPRYPVIPKIGSGLAPMALFHTGMKAVRDLQREGRGFDVIDAHYLYPDGVAAARLGRALRIPVVLTARGTDVTLIPSRAGPRRAISSAIREASASVAVCSDLGTRLVEMGAPVERTLVLRNGVDLETFRPGDRGAARATLKCDGFTIVSVGSLIERKGHALTIEALCSQPSWRLLIAGSGPLRDQLSALAGRLGVADRVRFLGEVPHEDLATLYTAADVMVLASSREGWANVLLEAMACGAPVAATDVNGTREVVASPSAGLLIPIRSPAAIEEAVRSIEVSPPLRSETRRYAEQFGWDVVARANSALLTAAGAAGYDRRHDSSIVAASRVLIRSEERDRFRTVASG